jgi:hypothetical protein
MEIAPIAGIRAVSLVAPHRVVGGEPLPFSVEDSARTDDEGRSANEQDSDRDLEENVAADFETEPEWEGAETLELSAGTTTIHWMA